MTMVQLKDEGAGGLTVQQFFLEDAIPLRSYGLNICFHQVAHSKICHSQFSDLPF